MFARKATQFALALTLFFLFLPTRAVSQQTFKVGVTNRRFIPKGDYDWRGSATHALITTIWYPADSHAVEQPRWIGNPKAPFATLARAANDAPIVSSSRRFPLIVLSHGTGGSALMMDWLGARLAAEGFIAAAVNHPGNNALEPYTPQGFLLWWERAKDLSTVLDALLSDRTFGARIDSRRIGAAGFSLGGFTMMEIAGGISDPQLYSDFCNSPRADGMCAPPPEFPDLPEKYEELSKKDPALRAAMQQATNSCRDSRVRAMFAIAPALGPAFRPESLKQISIPVAIVAGSADTIVPVASSAKFFASNIPHAQLTILPDVGHYTFLAECGEQGRQSKPQLCTDRPTVDRAAVHSQTARLAIQFFRKYLK